MQVSLNGSLRSGAGGASNIEIEAGTIKDLLERLVDRYPDMRKHMDDGIAVAINGEVYRDDWTVKIPSDAEVVLLPRIQGG
ncbi:MAG: MoaD/ThiS family protein [Pseudomonadales bacterium]|nr:MoaD/ThiS family protein [Pseudomonadales bacterium]